MTNFDYAHLIQAATDPTATGGTVYNQGIIPEADHFIVGGLATMTFPKYVWDGLTWPTRAQILKTFIETFEDRNPGTPADTLGFWIDRRPGATPDRDTIYWDLGTVHADFSSALKVARLRGERAIFDTADQDAIPV